MEQTAWKGIYSCLAAWLPDRLSFFYNNSSIEITHSHRIATGELLVDEAETRPMRLGVMNRTSF